MILKNRKHLVITSLLTLLPIPAGLLLWDRFPEVMAIHWGFTGEADGYASVPLAVFAPPLMMLAVQWLCILATGLDKGNKNRNRKIQILVLWIIPILSNFSNGMMYALALGSKFSAEKWMMPLLGLLFAAIGNYLPKTKKNSTIGIRVPWTFSSEANWNATHRMAGKVWMAGGSLMVLTALLPEKLGISVMVIVMIVICVVPMAYSYVFYRREKASGAALIPMPKMGRTGIFALAVTLVLLVAVLFTGKIEYHFREDYLLIDTNMYSDNILYYDAIEAVEFREGNVPGLRVGGYGSFRLLMGWFENEEFGTYLRYTYYKPESCVIVTLKNTTLVLSGKNDFETRAIHQALLLRKYHLM